MTMLIRTTLLGLIICVACQEHLFAAETSQAVRPVRFSVGFFGQATDNRDAVAEDKTGNTDIYVRPKLELVYETEASRLDLHYTPAFRYRSDPGDTQDETTWQHDFGVAASRLVSDRMRLRFNGVIQKQDDPAIEEGGITRRGDLSYTRSAVDAGMNFDVMKYSNVDIVLQNRMKRYDDDIIAATSDEDENTIRVEHRHQMTRTLRSLLTGGYSVYTYDSSLDLERDFSSGLVAIGVENAFTPNTLGSISVGSQTRDYQDEGIDSDNAPYVRVSLEGLLAEDLRIGCSLGQGVRDTDAYPFVSQEYSEFRGFGNAMLSSKVRLRVSATYRVSTYKEDNIPSNVTAADIAAGEALGYGASGDETTIVGDAELTFTAAENLSFFAGIRIEDIDSDVGQSYTKNTGRIGASVSL